jgi:hypothetical protein
MYIHHIMGQEGRNREICQVSSKNYAKHKPKLEYYIIIWGFIFLCNFFKNKVNLFRHSGHLIDIPKKSGSSEIMKSNRKASS